MGRSARRLALLEYLIRAEIDGTGETLKAYSIGLDVFDKPNDFDPSADSSVRVEIGRLRTAIALFEASEMATTTLRIEIPVGTYRPLITPRHSPSPDTAPAPGVATPTAPPRAPLAYLPVALVAVACIGALAWGLFALLDKTQHDQTDYYPISLSIEDFAGEDLGKEIAIIVRDNFANNSIVKVLDQNSLPRNMDYYVFRGRVSENQGYARVSAELADLATNQIVWNHVFRMADGADLQTEIETELNGELYTRLFGAAKKSLEQHDPADLTPQQLFVLATWVSGPAESSLKWETERVDLMKIALKKDPDFGPAHSVLADKYGFLANVYQAWDTPENRALSRQHASRAAELSPLDATVMFNVAQSYWHAGRHAESQRTFKRVTELDHGNSLARFFATVVPYWCANVPDDVMDWALNFDRDLSPDDPIRWIVLTWIATLHTNRGEYDLGLQAATKAAQIFQVGYTYMARAMLLNKLGDPDAAAEVIERQRQNWPAIGAAHYATATIPRLCTEQPNPERFIADYTELTQAMVGRLD